VKRVFDATAALALSLPAHPSCCSPLFASPRAWGFLPSFGSNGRGWAASPSAYTTSARFARPLPERTSLTGSLLRLRLHELPQLFNILRGDMSFAGPGIKLAWNGLGHYAICRGDLVSKITDRLFEALSQA
jgi:hypothetical protein